MRLPGWLYNCVQRCFGLQYTRERLAPHLAQTSEKRILDVGGGTGLYRHLCSPTAQYFWLDIDPGKLAWFRRAHPGAHAVLGDATRLCFLTASVDIGLCVALSHHLSDSELPTLFRELGRVVRERLVFLDAVECASSWVSRLLWRWDDGTFPRRAEVLFAAMEDHFEIEYVEEYRVYHACVLCVARPRGRPKQREEGVCNDAR